MNLHCIFRLKIALRTFYLSCLLPLALLNDAISSSQQQQQPEPNFQDVSTQSWYPPSVGGSSSHPSTPTSSSASPHHRASDHSQSSSRGQPSPAEAAGIIARLKDKRYATVLLFCHYCLHRFFLQHCICIFTVPDLYNGL